MKIITTVRDVTNYVDRVTQFFEREDGHVDKVVEKILGERHPDFGSDWSDFFQSLAESFWQVD